MGTTRRRFDGYIVGVGTASGTRIVLGHWPRSPLGAFSDVMVEFTDGHRLLLAPTPEVRDFVTATYTFDDIALVPVDVTRSGRTWQVHAGDLTLRVDLGRTTMLGALLRMVPAAVASAPWFCRITDPVARVCLRGVRTRGSAGNGRREYYGALGQWRVNRIAAAWRGADLGSLQPIEPPVRFGFGSTPRAPSSTRIVTTVEVPRS